jgi:alpha-amylase
LADPIRFKDNLLIKGSLTESAKESGPYQGITIILNAMKREEKLNNTPAVKQFDFVTLIRLLKASLLVCAFAAPAAALLFPGTAGGGVIFQYFESKYGTMEHRIPDVFMAGYDSLWIPPTGKAEGGQSAGYDVFDRFNFNNFYGNEEGFKSFLKEAHKANLQVYADVVLNHNAFQNSATPGFVDKGDYPGFVLTVPNDVDGDFHGAREEGRINERINGGLVDIAHEKNHQFIRHPVDPSDTRNIPKEVALKSNRRLYPDSDPHSPPELGDTSSDKHSPSGFNLSRPEAGDPVVENATGLLLRYCKWMIEVVGVDGFRLDAAKHIAPFFLNDFYDRAVFRIGPNKSTPFSFGEVIAGRDELDLLREYARKDGFGKRDVLDFPLYFTMREIFNAHGFADMGLLERATADGLDGNPNDGTFGVTFVSNHDEFAPPPAKDNIAYAHILTRPGYPIVYFNALEFGTGRNFPLRGRGDALGGEFGETIKKLVAIHNGYVRGPFILRHADNDAYIYERDQALIVGLNDNEAFDADRSIQTSFPTGTTLVELTGNPRATNPLVIKADGKADLKIPNNGGPGLGYAIWGPKAPEGSKSVEPLTITPVNNTVAPDGTQVPNGVRRITPLEKIIENKATLTLTLEDEGLDDNAIVRIDDGKVNVIGTEIFRGGEFRGFQPFTNADPGVTGKAVYSATLDISKLGNGTHYIEAICVFKKEPRAATDL